MFDTVQWSYTKWVIEHDIDNEAARPEERDVNEADSINLTTSPHIIIILSFLSF